MDRLAVINLLNQVKWDKTYAENQTPFGDVLAVVFWVKHWGDYSALLGTGEA